MKIIVSHDIDHLKPSDNVLSLIVPKAILRSGIEMFIGTITFREFRLRIINIIKNKWQNIDGLMDFDKENGINATYFVGVNNGLGLEYSIKDATYWIHKILDRGFDVGVHGIDYDSYEAVKREYDIFKEISGLETFGIRMHYLRTEQETYDYMAQSGYLFDATQYGLGRKHGKIEQMYEFPLHIMDGYEIETNRQWQTIKTDEAIQNTIDKIKQAEEQNIEYLSILLHPKYFDNSFETWKIWYKSVIDYCKDNSYEFIDYRSAIKELNTKTTDFDKSIIKGERVDKLSTSNKNIKICHISTVHQRQDVRIFHKECISLSKFYEVHLIMADGKGDELNNEVHIHDIGMRQDARIKRIRIDAKKALKKALALDCMIYHFHDPELILIAKKLKQKGKKVIYDVHEDLPRQIYGKPYLSKIVKPVISFIIEYLENSYAKKMDYIVTATPFIYRRFVKVNKNSIDVNNFPIIKENIHSVDIATKDNFISYVGGIFENRGVFELIESLKISKVKLLLAGDFEDKAFMKKCQESEGWKYVDYYGFVSRKEVVTILNKSKIGIVSLYPLRNYLDSLPIKMFEYMLASIPVLASNFPYWEKIVLENNCGVTVNPRDVEAIAEKTNYLLQNPELAAEMGRNGRKAVLEKFNWCNEEKKLFDVYKNVIK